MNSKINAAAKMNPAKGRNAESQPVVRFDYARRRSNQMMSMNQLLAVLKRESPPLYQRAAVVGSWVWLSFESPQPQRVTKLLSLLGFHWSPSRLAWQHPCNHVVDGKSGSDPRQKYGGRFPAKNRN